MVYEGKGEKLSVLSVAAVAGKNTSVTEVALEKYYLIIHYSLQT